VKGWENLFDTNDLLLEQQQKPKELFDEADFSIESQEAEKASVFQFQNRYIISSIKSGLVLIDQQRAHERIVYEQYLDRIRQSQQVIQQELFPCQVTFSQSDAELLDEIMIEMNILGFQLNKLGKNTFVVSGTPSGMQETDLQSLMENFLEQYKKNLIELDLDKSTNLARSLACSLSARSTRKLYTEEMIHLIDELFSCKVPDLTPDGRKVFTIIPVEQVQHWLNR
jgi:DNA mismatch repair protein MutL